MPIGGKLVLKGGETLGGGGVKKKKKKSKKDKGDRPAAAADGGDAAAAADEQQPNADGAGGSGSGSGAKPPTAAAPGITVKGTSYEQEFDLEMQRLKQGKARSTAWGSSYRAPPPVLHGYDRAVAGRTASERLDLRAAGKADKFCK